MNGRALYIEIDEYCRAWLRNLIAADFICPGDVIGDILDVRPRDLDRYNQVHAFAGIGIWSGALRDAGYRDDEHVWTGSCPCQPFSAAGQRGGFADERHLWPAFFHLIEQCRPAKVFGEQVASPDGLRWLDLVSSDLEGTGYAIGAADLCAAGIAVAAGETEVGQPTLEWIRGAVQSCPDPFLAAELRDYAEWFDREAGVGPAHIRQRLCWVAYAADARSLPGAYAGIHRGEETRRPRDAELERQRDAGGLAHSDGGDASAEWQQPGGKHGQQPQDCSAGAWRGSARVIGDAARHQQREPRFSGAGGEQQEQVGRSGVLGVVSGRVIGDTDDARSQGRQRLAGPTSLAGWTRADWIICADGKARPIEPGTFPLAHGQSNRVGRLRAYGNAMHRSQIAEFIRAADEAIGDLAS